MKMLLITHFFVGFMVSEIPRVSVFGYFPLYVICYYTSRYWYILIEYFYYIIFILLYDDLNTVHFKFHIY